ncbi:hypothetical protein H8F21_14765 [Pseudomonas sp. P66]|uniref:Uncharacterized protein n=1 Tax=Pseudomonas arcuscaelestis TaxID=2710591 RepID=A0ABS2C0I1_9PSED|nr:hypothetical protein [Pseudomonas arcuscaelestis]MBM5458828.1 hypothetical protein [Pseudomonas arcuscaelestis]
MDEGTALNPHADLEKFAQAMKDLAAAHEAHRNDPVPMCHFRPMVFHDCDSNPNDGGYQCDFCGHSESSELAWVKVDARVASSAAP